MILRMLNSKIHKEISFSPDALDRLTEVLELFNKKDINSLVNSINENYLNIDLLFD